MEEVKVLIDKKRTYHSLLPCPKCGVSMLYGVIKNGVRYVVGRDGCPEQIWNADLYKCPSCESMVLTDFGRRAQYKRKNSPESLPEGIQTLSQLVQDDVKRGNLVFFSWQFNGRVAA